MNLSSLNQSRILSKTTANEPFYANRMPSVHARALPFKGTFNYVQSSFWVDDVFLSTATRWPSVTTGVTIGHQTMVGMSMEDPPDLVFNGHVVERPALTIGAHNSEYWASEGAPWTSVIAIFPANMTARGWPDARSLHLVVAVTPEDIASLRALMLSLFSTASLSPEIFDVATAVAGMRESIYLAYDRAFSRADEPVRNPVTVRHYQLMRRLDALLDANVGRPIYTDDIVAELNVTARTLHTVTQRASGLSLHRYLRLKRLWSVRWALMANPDRAIKNVALDHGFWHLGRFAVEYKRMFGEAPSQTARTRPN